MRLVYLAICALVTLTGCYAEDEFISPLPPMMPDDFNLSLKYGVAMANDLNTYEDTFTKDLISDGTAITEMVLHEKDKQFIYEKLRSVDILALPNTTGSTCTEPSEQYDLTMTADGKEYSLEWNTSCNAEKLDQWESVMDDIKDNIIHSREEYQSLPEASGGYM